MAGFPTPASMLCGSGSNSYSRLNSQQSTVQGQIPIEPYKPPVHQSVYSKLESLNYTAGILYVHCLVGDTKSLKGMAQRENPER